MTLRLLSFVHLGFGTGPGWTREGASSGCTIVIVLFSIHVMHGARFFLFCFGVAQEFGTATFLLYK